MTGQDLIIYIKEHELEDCEIAFRREAGDAPDRCYGGICAELEESSIGFVYVF